LGKGVGKIGALPKLDAWRTEASHHGGCVFETGRVLMGGDVSATGLWSKSETSSGCHGVNE
jgi:hypothetical protein